jgi:hypothetical protein
MHRECRRSCARDFRPHRLPISKHPAVHAGRGCKQSAVSFSAAHLEFTFVLSCRFNAAAADGQSDPDDRGSLSAITGDSIAPLSALVEIYRFPKRKIEEPHPDVQELACVLLTFVVYRPVPGHSVGGFNQCSTKATFSST